MRKAYFILVLSILLCGCFEKEIEEPSTANTFYDDDVTEENSHTINTDIWDKYINTEENIIYDNGMYFDWERCIAGDTPIYYKNKKDGKVEREYIPLDSGYLFEILDAKASLSYLQSANHIEFFIDSSDEENQILGWFEYRLVVDGHVYFLDQGNLNCSDLYGDDTKWLDFICSNTKYKDGYIYFLYREEDQDNRKLYRMKLDGIEKEQLSSFHSDDYCLTKDGAVHLVEKGNRIFIIYEKFGENGDAKMLAEFSAEQFHYYQIAGMIDDTVYLSVMYSRMITETDKVEIYACKDGELELVHISEDKSNTRKFKPFVHEDNIYYWTAEGLFEFSPKGNSCIMIAKTIFGFNKAY